MTGLTTLYLIMLGLSLLLMTPLAWLFRRTRLRDRRGAALELHKAQLAELARDHADGRIGEAEYRAAKIEVERRLLSADTVTEPAMTGNARLLLVGTVIAIPIMAFALYLPGSTPGVPSEPHDQWVAQQANANARLTGLIAGLRMHLAGIDPNSVDASQGEAYLAEALSEEAGEVTPEALSYFKQSLASAPPTASWRSLDLQRIAQGNAENAQE
jgi:cytochrome c-type biogenesis protein CcmH